MDRNYTILLADDNEATRYAIRKVLVDAGFCVVTANNGRQAVEHFKTHTPDLIIIDVNMPIMDGFEATAKIREDSNTAHIPILFISARYKDVATEVKALEVGGNDYITEPIDNEELVSKVKAMLRVKDLYDELLASKEMLRKSEQKFRLTFEHAVDAIFWADPKTAIITNCNKAAEVLLEKQRAEIIGQHHTTLHPPEKSDYYASMFNKAVTLQKTGGEDAEVITKSGKIKLVNITASITSIGEHAVIVATFHDITERKQAEAQLEYSEQRFRALAESIPVGIYCSDFNGTFLYVNRKAEEIIGYKSQELIGKNFLKLSLLSTQDIARAAKSLELSKQGKPAGPTESEQFIVTRKDGEKRFIDINTEIINFEGQEAIVGMVQDITERKQAEEHILNLAKFPSENPNLVLRISADGTIIFANEASSPVLQTWGRKQGQRLPNNYCKQLKEVLDSGKATSFEFQCQNNQVFSITLSPVPQGPYVNAYGHDITARKKAEQALKLHEHRLEALLELNKMTDASQQQITAFVLEQSIKITQSKFAFIGLMNEDESAMSLHGWSKTVMAQCAVIDKPVHFPIAEAGLWGQALRLRKPIIVNNYDHPHADKNGFPNGHVPIKRLLCIPVIDGQRITVVAAVANKAKDYNKSDVNAFTSMLNDMWRIIRHKHAEKAVRDALDESKQRSAETSALLEGARAVLENREFEDAARSIFNTCKNLIQATAGYVALLSKDGVQNEVVFLDSGGSACAVDPNLPMPIRGLREQAYRTGKPVYDNDFANSQWTKTLPKGHANLTNVLFAPLKNEGKVAGLLGLANKPGGFSDNDVRLAAAFGELASVALYNSRTLESLTHSEQRFRSVAETANDAIVTINHHGNIIYWNHKAETIFGYSATETLGKPVTVIMPKRFQETHQQGITRLLSTGNSKLIGKTIELVGLKKDGTEFPLELSLATWQTAEDTFFTAIMRNVTERKEIEARQLLAGRILERVNQPDEDQKIIPDVLTLIKESMDIEAAGIRLCDGDDFPYFAVDGFPAEFVEAENSLHCLSGNCEKVYDSKGNPVLDCMCGDVICKRIDPSLPFFTETGSFWTNSTTVLLDSISTEIRDRLRNRCNIQGYESVALIPLCSNKEVIGLLQLNDSRQGRFTPEIIRFLEGIGASIGIAMARIKAEEQIRKLNQELEQRVANRTAELTDVNKQLLQEMEQRKVLERDILDISEREKRLIGQELHDSVGQQIAGVAFMSEALQQKLSREASSQASYAAKIANLARQALGETRGLAKGLHPIDLTTGSLISALKQLTKNTEQLFSIHCTFKCDKPLIVDDAMAAVNLYRITQEAITNAIRHGKAKNVHVELSYGKEHSTLVIENDGSDFSQVDLNGNGGMGLKIMDYRAEMIDSSLAIRTGPKGGTIVTCAFPNAKLQRKT